MSEIGQKEQKKTGKRQQNVEILQSKYKVKRMLKKENFFKIKKECWFCSSILN